MNTFTDKLVSGVPFEVSELTGTQQRILTEQGKSGTTHNDKLDELILSVLVKVGPIQGHDLDKDFVENMLACDRQKVLTVCRQFSLDFEDSYEFKYPYLDNDGTKQIEDIVIPIEAGKFDEKELQILKQAKDGKVSYEPVSYTEYADIIRKVRLILPRTKTLVEFTMLDGKGEKRGAATSKKARSSHTLIKMRTPVYFADKSKKESVPIQLNLDKLPIKDIEFLRAAIKAVEGNVDTTVMFEHPDSENKNGDDKTVSLDLIGTVAFFFPSEAI